MMEYRNSREFPREFLDSEIRGNSRAGIPVGLAAKRHPVYMYYRPMRPCMVVTYSLNLIIISMAYISLVLRSGLRKSKKKTSSFG